MCLDKVVDIGYLLKGEECIRNSKRYSKLES